MLQIFEFNQKTRNKTFSLSETIKQFLTEFCTTDADGNKIFKYAAQLTRLAHREQIQITIDLDDLADYNESLAEAIQQNTVSA